MLPGARDSYIDLGRFYDTARLEKRRSELGVILGRYKAYYAMAYRYLSAAGDLMETDKTFASSESIKKAAENCAALLPSAPPEYGSSRHCFIDAFCGSGFVSVIDKPESRKVYTINSAPSDGNAVLQMLGIFLENNAYKVYFCHDPLFPSLLSHILVPTHKTIFTLRRTPESICAAALAGEKPDEKLNTKFEDLIENAREMLTSAKQAHDLLEEVYNPCVDFSGVRREAQRHINTIL